MNCCSVVVGEYSGAYVTITEQMSYCIVVVWKREVPVRRYKYYLMPLSLELQSKIVILIPEPILVMHIYTSNSQSGSRIFQSAIGIVPVMFR